MSKEYSNQKVREGKCEVCGEVKLNVDGIDLIQKQFWESKYVPVDDLHLLLDQSMKQLLSSVDHQSSWVTCGIDADLVRQLRCVLLRVQAQKNNVTEGSNLERQTEEEVKAFEKASEAAARVARKISSSKDVTTLEDYQALISGTNDPEYTENLLLSAKLDDEQVQLPSGKLLPVIVPPPKTMTSKSAITVRLKVVCVDEERHAASVQIAKEVGTENQALAGLTGKTLTLEFSKTKRGVRNILIGMQLIQRPIPCKVTLVRALRACDKKLTMLKLIRCISDSNQKMDLLKELTQIEMDFGAEEETAAPSAPIDHQDVAAPALQ